MNPIEIGNFIRELRKEKNMSQNDLAEKLYLSRNAVSRWENGHNLPDSSSFSLLAKIFDVSTDELLLGKRTNKEERENEISSLTLTMVDQNHRKNKIIKRLIIVFVTLLLMFLCYYFVNSYNSIKVYIMSGQSENFFTKDGIFVITNDKLYFRLGNLEFDNNINIEEVTLFYKKDNDEILIFSSDGYDILLRDYNGYDAYFKSNNMKYIINDLYLRIKYNDTFEDIKINLEKDFSNNSLVFRKIEKEGTLISNSNTENFDSGDSIIKFSKDKMICEKNSCVLEIIDERRNTSFYFFEEERILQIESEDGKCKEHWIYYMEEEVLSYRLYDNNGNSIEHKMINLNIDNKYTSDERRIVNNFNEKYILKHLQ